MSSTWHQKILSDVAMVSTGPFGSLLHKSDYTDQGVPLVNPINIQGECIVPDPTKLIDQATKERLSSYVLEDGDVVVGRRGEIGRCAVVGPREAGWVCGTGSFFVRPSNIINSYFLAHVLRSRRYRTQLVAASTGATMSNLSNKSLGNLLIPVPDLEEQKLIVEKISTLHAETERLEELYKQKLDNLKELGKSILEKAIAGELTRRPKHALHEAAK